MGMPFKRIFQRLIWKRIIALAGFGRPERGGRGEEPEPVAVRAFARALALQLNTRAPWRRSTPASLHHLFSLVEGSAITTPSETHFRIRPLPIRTLPGSAKKYLF